MLFKLVCEVILKYSIEKKTDLFSFHGSSHEMKLFRASSSSPLVNRMGQNYLKTLKIILKERLLLVIQEQDTFNLKLHLLMEPEYNIKTGGRLKCYQLK